MAEGGKHYHHGRTPAAWTGTTISGVGFVLATIAFLMGPNWIFVWVSVAVILAGAVVGGIMSKMGMGAA
ncbi:MAG: HGxxPAAW family protein [Micropruina sp.]